MFKWASPIHDVENMLAMAKACDHASQRKQGVNTIKLQTDDGDYDAFLVQQYVAGAAPSIVAWRKLGRVVVAIAGIGGNLDASQVFQGYLDPQSMPDIGGMVNKFAKTWYTNTATFLASLTDVQDIVFAGHSWGSSLATIWAARFNKFFDPKDVKVRLATFGAPRFADADFFHDFGTQTVQRVRVMNWQDPIPYILPMFTEAPALSTFFTISQIRKMTTIAHMSGGVRIKTNNLMQWTEAPHGFAYPLEWNIPFIISVLSNGVIPHLTASYVSVLQERFNDLNPPSHFPQGNQPNAETEPTIDILPDEAVAVANFPRRAWPARPQGGNVPGAPQAPLLKPANDPVQAGSVGITIRKIEGTWYVLYLGETPIYKGESKRDARAFARGARALAVQYRQRPFDVMDTAALQAAFEG